jgi:hypothetical protein
LAGQELQAVPIATIAAWVYEIVQAESPIHSSEIVRRLSDLAGVKRVSAKTQSTIEEAIRYLSQKSKIVPRGDFLWLPDMQVPAVRDRSELAIKKAELIAPQEIAAAIRKAVEATFGIGRDDLPQAVCHLLGLTRATDDVKAYVEQVLSGMIDEQLLIDKGNHISLAT